MDNNFKIDEETLRNMAEQAQSIYAIYKQQNEMTKSMAVMSDKMSLFDAKMERVEYKIDNRLTLDEAQMSEMTDAVRDKAIKIGEYLDDIAYYKNKSDFGEVVGAVKMGIRAMVKAKYGVNRWFKIREQDYESAMQHINELTVQDFLNYRKKREKLHKRNYSFRKAQ